MHGALPRLCERAQAKVSHLSWSFIAKARGEGYRCAEDPSNSDDPLARMSIHSSSLRGAKTDSKGGSQYDADGESQP